MTKPALVSRAQLAAVQRMPVHMAAQQLGVSIKYLHARARQLSLKMGAVDDAVPPVMRRRCACGNLFDCRDVARDLTCERCT